jgi:hypothetical protein
MGMMDELQLEELSVRMNSVKMDVTRARPSRSVAPPTGACLPHAFCEALQRAIDAGTKNSPTVVSKQPGARNPKTLTPA